MKKTLIYVPFLVILVCLALNLSACKKKVTKVEGVAATCTASGKLEHYVDSDGRIFLDEECTKQVLEENLYIAKVELVHVDKKEPTRNEVGYLEHYKCPVCGKLYSSETASEETLISLEEITIPMLEPLIYVERIEPTCTECGIEAHYTNKDNTILYKDKEGTIVVEYEDLSIPQIELIKVDRVEPTYLEKGNIEYYKCPVCGKLYSSIDAYQGNEITLEETVLDELPITASITKYPTVTSTGSLKFNVTESEFFIDLPVLSEDNYSMVYVNYNEVNTYTDKPFEYQIRENSVAVDNVVGFTEDVYNWLINQHFSVVDGYLYAPSTNYRGYVESIEITPNKEAVYKLIVEHGTLLASSSPIIYGNENIAHKISSMKVFENGSYKDVTEATRYTKELYVTFSGVTTTVCDAGSMFTETMVDCKQSYTGSLNVYELNNGGMEIQSSTNYLINVGLGYTQVSFTHNDIDHFNPGTYCSGVTLYCAYNLVLIPGDVIYIYSGHNVIGEFTVA